MNRKSYLKVFLVILLFSASMFGQLYQGPLQGSVPAGVVVNTGTFLKVSTLGEPKEHYTRNKEPLTYEYQHIDFGVEEPKWQDYYQEDLGALGLESNDSLSSIILKSFNGIPMGNSIPPDPYIAAGPNHIILTVNTSFAIFDKQGNHQKTITASSWYNTTGIAANSPFDPKVVYDHYANRWFMVWLNVDDATRTAYFLVSVSDDSDPNGKWHNWALPSHMNGSTAVNNWGDYQGVGFDASALYITSNQFTFEPYNYQYTKLRIIPKAALLAATPGAVSWFDMFNIRVPVSGFGTFTIRPTIPYGNTRDYHLVYSPSGGNYMTVYKITDPATNPVMTAVNIPTASFSSAPLANQLGGGSPLLESGGGALKFEPVVRDNFVYIIHAVANPSATQFAGLHYLKLNIETNTKVEEIFYGASNFWYIYPAITVDKNENVALSFSRSGTTEYAGAYYTVKRKAVTNAFAPTRPMQAGKGNYVVTYGGTRNRWGDYNGIWLDPVSEENFWLFAEYASGTNQWGTWVNEVRVSPYASSTLYTTTPTIEFDPVEVGFESQPKKIFVQNFGASNLVINDIPLTYKDFRRITPLTFPITLAAYESFTFDIVHKPTVPGIVTDSLAVLSNDPIFSNFKIKARGYQINSTLQNILYASTSDGKVLTVNPTTAVGAQLGNSNYASMTTMAVNPKTGVMFGIRNEATSARLVRVNAAMGDAYTYDLLPTINVTGASFDTSGTLYIALRSGVLYKYNLATKQFTYVDSAKATLSGIAFHPATNELWASGFKAIGVGKDKIFKINLANGDTTNIGVTGFAVNTTDIEFNANKRLYGIKGTSQDNELFEINLTTGIGTSIGPIGIANVNSIAFNVSGPVSVQENQPVVPSDFSLSQNYPNPFNPSTTIEYALPIDASVRLSVYNLLGEEVNRLFDGMQKAGSYKISWNADDKFGKKLSTGVYFYEMRGNLVNGKEFSLMKKMILMK